MRLGKIGGFMKDHILGGLDLGFEDFLLLRGRRKIYIKIIM
jgi:hypothetical protein